MTMQPHKERDFVERLSFYADSTTIKNKHYCFDINSMFDLHARLMYWRSKLYLRAAWYQVMEKGTIVKNDKIDLVYFVDYNDLAFISTRDKTFEIKGHNPLVIAQLMEMYKADGLSNEQIQEKIKAQIDHCTPATLEKKANMLKEGERMMAEIQRELHETRVQLQYYPFIQPQPPLTTF